MIECIWRYLRLLWVQYLFHRQTCCIWNLTWCKFCLYRSVHMQISSRYNLKARYKLTIEQYFHKLIIGRPHHHTHDQKCTNVLSNCKDCWYNNPNLRSLEFINCSIQTVGFFFYRDALEQLRWKCRLRVIFVRADVLLR